MKLRNGRTSDHSGQPAAKRTRKRRTSDHGGRPTGKSARTETTKSILDQEITGPETVFNISETSGIFRIQLKLRSTLKAARNDPEITPPQRELYRKLLSEWTDGKLNTPAGGTADDVRTGKMRENDKGEENDDACEDGSEFDEMDWLEPIDVKVVSAASLDDRGVPMNIACCHAKLIRRNQMRHVFDEEMELATRETSLLALDLFDRYGRLRSEFKTHLVIKGIGIWGQEIDNGDILLIEHISVEPNYRRRGVGRRMMEALLTLVRLKALSFFAFAWPTGLRSRDFEQEWNSLQNDAARDDMETREHDWAVMFHKSLGFRRVGSSVWFAIASDNDHSSHQLKLSEDYDPPKPSLTALHPLLSPFQQIGDPPPPVFDRMLKPQPREWPDFLKVLDRCMQLKGPNDVCWTSRDEGGIKAWGR